MHNTDPGVRVDSLRFVLEGKYDWDTFHARTRRGGGWPDLNSSDLHKHDFSGYDFSESILRNLGATHTDFSYANFQGADLSNANLTEATLVGANFVNTNLSGARLFKVVGLTKSDLRTKSNTWSADTVWPDASKG